jgi:hypothetical protein
MSNPYTHSGPGYKLATGQRAREERAGRALSAIGPFPCFRCESTGQNSSSVAVFPSGLRALVSYTTVVAYKLPDGSSVAAPYGEYSRTTDRAVAEFARNPIRLHREEFVEALRQRLASEPR